jgi:hypothetical protein
MRSIEEEVEKLTQANVEEDNKVLQWNRIIIGGIVIIEANQCSWNHRDGEKREEEQDTNGFLHFNLQ